MSDQVTEHPEELLAEYAEGGLSPEDRARVETHLAGCETCREELSLAREAVAALSATPEVAPPPGLELAVRRRSRGPSRAVWIAAGAAAAAAGVIVAAILVLGPQGGGEAALSGGGGSGGSAERAPEDQLQGAGPTAPGGALAEDAASLLVQETDKDYSATSLATLGRRLRDSARASLEQRQALADTAQQFFADFELDELPGRTRAAVNCVFDEVPPEQLLVPYAIQSASFEGEAAYVAAFLQGPSNDTPYDRLLIWVVDRETCSLRYYAAHQL
jgi:Putative zinc-finger